ncbi:MAG: DUF6206 family protein [Actinomycetota bacterium]
MVDDATLLAVEAAVARAIATRDASGLRLLGHGEISVVLGWPADAPTVACKRLPPFDSRADFAAYAEVVERYVAGLRTAGVRVVDTEVRGVPRPDGRIAGFHLQPVLPAAEIGTAVLAAGDPRVGHPLIGAVVDAVVAAGSDRLGVDAQLANWWWHDGEARQLDLTTPFTFTAGGRPELDLTPFLRILPVVLRPVVRREMVKLMGRWRTPRGALADVVANAMKVGLQPWVDPLLARVNAVVDPPVTVEEARRMLADDARLFPLLLRVERANRWWQQRVRRRPYEFLLPESTTYSP